MPKKFDPKPFKKGDLIAFDHKLAPPHTIGYHSCRVVVARVNPVWENTRWIYGSKPCGEIRLATEADLDRLIEIQNAVISRETEELARLKDMKDQLEQQETLATLQARP